MFFIFVFFFGLFVECPGYTYIVEIWPTHLRSEGATIGLGSFFLMTIAYNSPAAQAFATIGWRYYFVMVAVCLVSTTCIALYCPEVCRLRRVDDWLTDHYLDCWFDLGGNCSQFW